MKTEQISNYVLAASTGSSSDYVTVASASSSSDSNQVPKQLQKFYESFKDNVPGEYIMGTGIGIDRVPFGFGEITIDNVSLSVVDTADYKSATKKDMRFFALQGYAQLVILDTFYATCIMVGQENPADLTSIVNLVDQLTKTEEERKELEQKKIDEVSLHPSFFTSIQNNPVSEAESTYGLYIIHDKDKVTTDVVLQAIGFVDLVDNTVCGLSIAAQANINTFKNAMDFTVAGSWRFADSDRTTIAGKIGFLNGKLNEIGFTITANIPVATEVYFTQGSLNVRGFQEPKIAVAVGAGMAIGREIKVPDGLGIIRKALYSNQKSFYPVSLTVNCEINPLRNYYSLGGNGTFMGLFSVSGSVTYDNGDLDAIFRAGTVSNSYLNCSLTVDYHQRKDRWNVHGNFSGSLTVDWKLLAITVGGGVDVNLQSVDYTYKGDLYNKKSLTISVSGMGKVKVLFFKVSVSYQKTWALTISNTRLSGAKSLMDDAYILSGDAAPLDNVEEVMACESEDIAENKLIKSNISSDAIDAKSWKIDEHASTSGIVKIQVAAQYTLVDSTWRLIHSAGDTITVYTAENAADIVELKEFTHSYYELIIDTPKAGDWTLEILGDKGRTGGLYMDALEDEKIISKLEITEQTESAITFKYAAYTNSSKDKTQIALYAEEISDAPGENPFSGVIAYLEETKDGEYVWEIPTDFSNNSRYRFYISAISSEAAVADESNSVETTLTRYDAELECSWELFYSAEKANTVTAQITITNTGVQSTAYQWELLDHTNKSAEQQDGQVIEDITPEANILAAGTGSEIKGNSSITFQQAITITDELRDNPSSLQLTVTRVEGENKQRGNTDASEEEEPHADNMDEITFVAMDSPYSQEKTITWQAINGAVSYVLQYALEGDWEEGGVYIKDIHDTSYTLNIAPGEYVCRVMAMDKDGNAIGDWNEEEEFEIRFCDKQTIDIESDLRTSRGQEFSLNDGIYELNSTGMENFSGKLILYRNDMVQTKKKKDGISAKSKEKKILTLKYDNGQLVKDGPTILLDHGDYFWEWTRSGKDISVESEVSIELSGTVFSIEDDDREYTAIGGKDSELKQDNAGNDVETIEGEVGFSNKDAVWNYTTDDGGELSLSIKSGTTFDANVRIHVYEQRENNSKFKRIKNITVKAGEYKEDKVILNRLTVKNNFYIQVVSWDKGKGKHNTDYSFDVNFDAFHVNEQSTDILEIGGSPVNEWIGYRNEAHRYLMQVDEADRYAIRLQGDNKDAILKVCNVNGKVIKKMQIQADGTAYIDDLYLEAGNYFVDVASKDKGKGKYNTDYTLSASKYLALYPKGNNNDDNWEMAASLDGVKLNENVQDWVGSGDKTDFFKIDLTPAEDPASLLSIVLDDKTTQLVEDGILKFTCRDEAGRDLALEDLSSCMLNTKKTIEGLDEVYIGVSLKKSVTDVDYSFKVSMLASL